MCVYTYVLVHIHACESMHGCVYTRACTCMWKYAYVHVYMSADTWKVGLKDNVDVINILLLPVCSKDLMSCHWMQWEAPLQAVPSHLPKIRYFVTCSHSSPISTEEEGVISPCLRVPAPGIYCITLIYCSFPTVTQTILLKAPCILLHSIIKVWL